MKLHLLLTFFGLFFSVRTFAEIKPVQQTDTLKKGKGYILYSKTIKVTAVTISKKKKPKADIIYIYFGFPEAAPKSNAISGSVIGGKMGESRDNLPKFDKIDILTGKYDDIRATPDTKYRNLFAFTKVEFPIRLKLTSGLEEIDFEILEAGEWNIDIELKNN